MKQMAPLAQKELLRSQREIYKDGASPHIVESTRSAHGPKSITVRIDIAIQIG